MRNMPGIKSQMPHLPVLLKEDLASSVFLHSSQISQQLRGYYPRQLCSYSCNRNWKKGSRLPLRTLPSLTTRLLRCKLLGTSAFSSASSSVTNNNDDSAGLSFIHKDASQPPLLSNCVMPAGNGGCSSQGISSLAGGIVALGKFDALHIGHRELAIQAANIGIPCLLSFFGMAEILGWEPRPPVVAPCDRKRVLSSWASLCGNVTPKEFLIEFSKVRYLSPRQFVEKLSKELGVGGVVAGQNYRFGYKASGDSSDLARLCKEYGMKASIVDSVMDKKQQLKELGFTDSNEQGQVSSTRVRHALENGDMDYVSRLLGRHHRLMLMVKNEQLLFLDGNKVSTPRSCLLNIPPKEGLYRNCFLVIGDEKVAPCRVVIDATSIHLELDEFSPYINFSARNGDFLGIDFGESKV